MRERYYVHYIVWDELENDIEYIYDTDNIDLFVLDVFKTIKGNYFEICGSEELNMIDNFNWDEFFNENNIIVNEGDWFPHELVWKALENKVNNILHKDLSEEFKYNVLVDVVDTYYEIIKSGTFHGIENYYEINIFNNSKEFSKHFFNYLEQTIERYNGISILLNRIKDLNSLIANNKFPKNDFHEGILNEWLNIYHILCDNYDNLR